MPKISKKSLHIKQGDINEHIEFTVNYNTASGFYAEIPPNLNEAFDQLTDPDLKKLSAGKQYRSKYSYGGEHKKIVMGNTEADVVTNMRAIAVHLMSVSLSKVPVIVVWFENHTSQDKKDEHNLPEVGLELSATYCVKVSTGPLKSKYYIYSTHEWFGEMKERREEVYISSHRGSATIIPDTPENRQFVEDLHKAMTALVAKMKAFTKSPAAMLEMIELRQNLLTLPDGKKAPEA